VPSLLYQDVLMTRTVSLRTYCQMVEHFDVCMGRLNPNEKQVLGVCLICVTNANRKASRCVLDGVSSLLSTYVVYSL